VFILQPVAVLGEILYLAQLLPLEVVGAALDLYQVKMQVHLAVLVVAAQF
jgi:hypothetical protein